MNFVLRPDHRRGTAIVVVLALLAVMCVFMICTAQSIYFVKRELNLIEKKQLQRWQKTLPAGAQK